MADSVGNHPYLLVLLMHSVFLVPVISTKRGTNSAMLLFVLAVLLELAGTGGTFYLLYNETKSIEKIAYVAVAVLCLSIAWSPLVQRHLLKTPTLPDPSPPSGERVYKTHRSYTYGSGKGTPYTRSDANTQSGGVNSYSPYNGSAVQSTSVAATDESYQMTQSQDWGNTAGESSQRDAPGSSPKPVESQQTKISPPTWKLTIYMSSLKIVFTFGTALVLYCYALFGNKLPAGRSLSLSEFSKGWNWTGIDRSEKQYEMYYFVANMVSSVVGYIAGYIACTTCMQRGAFAIPLFLATPLSVFLLVALKTCHLYIPFDKDIFPNACDVSSDTVKQAVFIAATFCLCLAQWISYRWLILQRQVIVLLKEVQLFWTPMYNSVLLEQWMALTRKNGVNEDGLTQPKEKQAKVVICTTMYREADYEMRQLLESIQKIRQAQWNSKNSFDAHVFFDGAVKDKTPQEFVLQLVSLAESTLGVKASKCTKTITPYGMSLSWSLKNGESEKHNMCFSVHLKDNAKVKNKKRWSQVMYMSYVMDFMNEANDTDTYILTTDADVKFTPDSVEALLDLMTRDHSVGAVCARTHPLGSGPLVWYQIFEYAIGHWFQKAAEHVIGSVLCSPGCFSVYRCSALRDILPTYASNVEHAFDFLTKDMGEDRWLCTLMVQSGWRIEYCAASENSTHCPEEFDEFYKQRRRWVASTLANIMLLLKEWNIVAKLNHRVSFVFLIYQAILLFATLIGPSSVILVVSGGLVYGWGVDPISTIIIQVLVTIALTLTCLFCSSKTQLAACKVVTFVYSIVMTAVVVGTAVQIIQTPGVEIADSIEISTTTLYLGGMAGLFLLTGIVHLQEFVYLLHGVWFLLCLPSGYLVLIVYSICNITDRSWGTREVKAKSVVSRGRSWQENLEYYFRQIFFCCFKKAATTDEKYVQTETYRRQASVVPDMLDSFSRRRTQSQASDSLLGSPSIQETTERGYDMPDAATNCNHESSDEEEDYNLPKDVRKWLPPDMIDDAKNFEDAGFDNTMFIAGMTEKELKDIGITKKGVRQKLMEDIKSLPDFEIMAYVPDDVHTWLENIGLSKYEVNFHKQQIKTSKDMEILKSFGRNELEKELKITKPGHIKRFMYAIGRLRNPTERERKLIEVRKAIDHVRENALKTVNVGEYDFWDELRNKCLLPQSTAFGSEEDLKHKLGDLRNAWLMVFAVSNTLWLFLIETLASQGELLDTYGSNPVGLAVLVLFSIVLVVQFFAMLVHRVGTLTHYLGRAPYRFGDPINSSWAFNDKNQTLDDKEAIATRDEANEDAEKRIKEGTTHRKKAKKEEKQPLLGNMVEHVVDVHRIDGGGHT